MSFFILLVAFFMYYCYYIEVNKTKENEKFMKKIFYLTLILTSFLFSGEGDELINIGSISFQDMNWDNSGNIFYSRRNIQNITSKEQAVVIHFFTACFS